MASTSSDRLAVRLRRDARVHQASLEERLSRIAQYEAGDDIGRAVDLGAELRWAAEILEQPCVVAVKFAESPDLRIEFRGDDGRVGKAAFEVRRLRDKQEDVQAESRLRAASEVGRVVSYGKPAEFQDMVARAVRVKFEGAMAATNQVLVLISDSPNAIEDVELRVGASEVVQELSSGSMPYGAVICWWTPELSTRWCVRASEESLSAGFRDLLDSIPRLAWWPAARG